MHTKDFTEFSFKDLVIYARKYWLWISLAAFSAAVGTYAQFYDSSKYQANARFSVVRGESSHMQALTDQLSGAGSTWYDESESLIKKYLLYYNTSEFTERILDEIKENGEYHHMRGLESHRDSFKQMVFERVQQEIGLEEFFDQNKILKRYESQIMQRDILESPNKILALIRASLSVKISDDKVITLISKTYQPRAAIAIANAALKVSVKDLIEQDLTEVLESKAFLQGQIDELKVNLEEIEDTLIRVSSSKIVGKEADKEIDENLKQLKNQLLEAKAKKAQLNELIRQTRTMNRTLDFATRSKVVKMEREVIFWKAKYSSLNEIIMEMERNKPSTESNNLNLEQRIMNLERQKEFEYARIVDLQKLMVQMDVKSISIKNKVRIVDKASNKVVLKAVLPPEGVVAAMIIAAMMVMFMFYLKESLSPEIRHKEDISIFGFTSYGSVPELSGLTHLESLASKFKLTHKATKKTASPLFIPPDSPQAFVFGAIRSKIHHAIETSSKEMKVITVTSPRQGEGKSMIAGKLAACFALSNKKVLLIDGDHIRKDLSTRMDVSDYEGLCEILHDHGNLDELAHTSSEYPMLDFLPAGAKRGSLADILLTRASAKFIAEAREKYDIIVIDTPALLVAPDSLLLCRFADITSLILTTGKTKIHDVEDISAELQDNGVENIGTILNRHGTLLKYVYYNPAKNVRKRKAKIAEEKKKAS